MRDRLQKASKQIFRSLVRPSGIAVLCFIGILLIARQSYRLGKLEQTIGNVRAEQQKLSQLSVQSLRLEEEVRVLKRVLSRSKLLEPAVLETTFTPDGSERDDPFLGPRDSTVVIIGFSDYQCKPCLEFFSTTFQKLKSQFINSNRVKFIYRDFPLSSHPHAEQAAALAQCAGEQGLYWELHDLLFNNPALVDRGEFSSLETQLPKVKLDKLEECFQSKRNLKEIAADESEGRRIGIQGAPGFFVGRKKENGDYQGVIIRGAQPYAVFEAQLERLL